MMQDAVVSGDRGREHAVFELALERGLEREGLGRGAGAWLGIVNDYLARHRSVASHFEAWQKAEAAVHALKNPNRNPRINISMRIPRRPTAAPKPGTERFARGATAVG